MVTSESTNLMEMSWGKGSVGRSEGEGVSDLSVNNNNNITTKKKKKKGKWKKKMVTGESTNLKEMSWERGSVGRNEGEGVSVAVRVWGRLKKIEMREGITGLGI